MNGILLPVFQDVASVNYQLELLAELEGLFKFNLGICSSCYSIAHDMEV